MMRDVFSLMSIHQRQFQHSSKPILWSPELLRVWNLIRERSVVERDSKVNIDRLAPVCVREDERVQQRCEREDGRDYR